MVLQEIQDREDTKESFSVQPCFILSQRKIKEAGNALQPFIRFSMNASLIRSQIPNYTRCH